MPGLRRRGGLPGLRAAMMERSRPDDRTARARGSHRSLILALVLSGAIMGALVWFCHHAHQRAAVRLVAQVDAAIERRSYQQAEVLLKHLKQSFGDTPAAAGIAGRQRICDENTKARKPYNEAVQLHQAGRFAEAAEAYQTVQREFPNTAYAEDAARKLKLSRQHKSRYAEACQAFAAGDTAHAVAVLDALEEDGVEPDPEFATRARDRLAREQQAQLAEEALALEKGLDWEAALGKWRKAQEVLETERGAEQIALCKRRIAHPVELTQVTGTVWDRRRAINFQARITNHAAAKVRNVKVRIRVYGKRSTSSDEPLSDKTYRISGDKVIRPGQTVTVRFGVSVPEAEKGIAGYDYAVVGFDKVG